MFCENPRVFADIAEWAGEPAGVRTVGSTTSRPFALGIGIYLEDLFVREDTAAASAGRCSREPCPALRRGGPARLEWWVLDWNEPAPPSTARSAPSDGRLDRPAVDGTRLDAIWRRSRHDRPLTLVVALADNGVIGRDNRLLWRLRTDLRRFRELTWGKPMIMGRRTFESIGKPLPGRETVVLTRDPAFRARWRSRGAWSWDEAVARGRTRRAHGRGRGRGRGRSRDLRARPAARSEMYLTEVHASPAGDAMFPSFDRSAFREVRRRDYPPGPDDEHPFTFIDLERRSTAASR